MEQLPSIEELQNCDLTCNHDAFFEVLIMAVKNSSLSHQHNIFKIKNAKKKAMEKKICSLKLNVHANAGEILRLEKLLSNIIEGELRDELMKMHKFEKLNDEKITPYFLSLAKRPHHAESLCDITNNDGTMFESIKTRSNYIKTHFADTYKRLPDQIHEQSINDFLGRTAEIPVVVASKLTIWNRN
jgi:hypothetical protein